MMNLNYQMGLFLYQIFKIILSIFKRKQGESIDKPPIQIYVNEIENRVTFKLKMGIVLKFKHQTQ